MCKTTYFRTLFVIALFWNITSGNPANDAFRTISNTQVFYNEDIVSISSLQKDRAIIDTADVDELMNDQPHLVYTALKCTYSDAIVELLQTIFEINECGLNVHAEIDVPNTKLSVTTWLTSSINHLRGIKPLIVKIIDNLFSYSDRHVVLKTSDQGLLLKSLLSINMFLCYFVNKSPLNAYIGRNKRTCRSKSTQNNFYTFVENVRKLNMSIIQMIGLVERFRIKKCFVRDPYEYNNVAKEKLRYIMIHEEKYTKLLLGPTMEKLHLLVYNGPNNDSLIFKTKVYDPEFMLFGNVLKHNDSFLEKVQIRWNGKETDLISAHSEIKSDYNIKNILEYQHLLIDAMADIFYGQLYHSLRNRNIFKTDIQCLQISFKAFIKYIMPNRLAEEHNDILISEIFLTDALEKYDNLELLTLLEDHLKPAGKNKESFYENVKQKFYHDPYLASYVNFIRNDEQYVTFIRVYELLTREAHTNCDYNIFMF